MAEVKKSYFLAISSNLTADEIAAFTDFDAAWAPEDSGEVRSAYLLEPSGLPDLSLDYEEVTRDVIRDSYLPAVPLRGIINTTGSMTFELHGGGANGTAIRAPDYSPLLSSGFGMTSWFDGPGVTDVAPDIDGSEQIGEVVTFDNTSAGASNGDVIVFRADNIAANGYVYWIVQVTDDTTPAATTSIVMYQGGVPHAVTPNWQTVPSIAYSMPSTLAAVEDFAIAYYRGNIVREIYAKCTVSSIEFPFTAGELILPVINFNVGDGNLASQSYFTAPSTYDPMFATATTSLTSTAATPLFAKSVDWKFEYADVTVAVPTWNAFNAKIVDSFTLTLNNETSVKKDITAPEGIHSYGVQGRSVELVLSAYYDEAAGDFGENLTDLFTAEGNPYRLRVSALTGTLAGNRCFLFAPRLSFKPTVTEDAGLFKYDVTGSAEKDETFGENALTCVFF